MIIIAFLITAVLMMLFGFFFKVEVSAPCKDFEIQTGPASYRCGNHDVITVSDLPGCFIKEVLGTHRLQDW